MEKDLQEENYLQEKAEIAGHILAGEWEAAHDKAFALLQEEPENIEFVVIFTAASGYGSFFQDAVDYGKKAVRWAEEHGTDFADNNFLGLSVVDIQEIVAQAYFGLKDFSSAASELEQIRHSLGRLPDDIKQFSVKNEYQLHGADAALRLAEQLDASFEDRQSEVFYNFKIFESQMCTHEVIMITGGQDFPSNLPLADAKKAAGYLLRMVNCVEAVDEDHRDENSRFTLKLGEKWLRKLMVSLYQGNSDGKPEMQTNQRYPAAKECLMVMEKLAALGDALVLKMLGDVYSAGYNTEKDPSKAFSCYQRAHEKGETSCLINLALYYDEGDVVEKDSQKALEYAKQALEAGVKLADTILGQIYVDSLGDIEQGLVHLKAACANGDEVAKNTLLRLARENVDDFDEKIQFILDVNAQAEKNIDSLDSQIELGKKYVRYYMEIEKYYIDPFDRIRFVAVCSDALPESLLKNGGFVPFEYFTDQIEKCIESLEASQRIQFIRTTAARANSLAGWEMIKAIAEGDFDLQSYGWQRMSRYIYNRSEEWGWDCLMEDGTKWGGVPSQEEPSIQNQPQGETKQTISSNQSYNANISDGRTAKSGGCYVATAVYGSYDCPEVWTLRRFRDYTLAETWYGRAFIRLYYAVSPTLVCWFGRTKWFHQFWRVKLDTLVKKLQDQGYENGPYQDKTWR